MNFCLNCIYWERVAATNLGICTSTAVAMNVALDGNTHLSEEGTLWTYSYFGCIYWKGEKGNTIIDINDVIEDKK